MRPREAISPPPEDIHVQEIGLEQPETKERPFMISVETQQKLEERLPELRKESMWTDMSDIIKLLRTCNPDYQFAEEDLESIKRQMSMAVENHQWFNVIDLTETIRMFVPDYRLSLEFQQGLEGQLRDSLSAENWWEAMEMANYLKKYYGGSGPSQECRTEFEKKIDLYRRLQHWDDVADIAMLLSESDPAYRLSATDRQGTEEYLEDKTNDQENVDWGSWARPAMILYRLTRLPEKNSANLSGSQLDLPEMRRY